MATTIYLAAEFVAGVVTMTEAEATVMMEGQWEDAPVNILLSPLVIWVLDPP